MFNRIFLYRGKPARRISASRQAKPARRTPSGGLGTTLTSKKELPLELIGNHRNPYDNISAAWAVDREFVNILGLTGEVSNLFWLDFELLWLSGVCSGLSRSTLRWI